MHLCRIKVAGEHGPCWKYGVHKRKLLIYNIHNFIEIICYEYLFSSNFVAPMRSSFSVTYFSLPAKCGLLYLKRRFFLHTQGAYETCTFFLNNCHKCPEREICSPISFILCPTNTCTSVQIVFKSSKISPLKLRRNFSQLWTTLRLLTLLCGRDLKTFANLLWQMFVVMHKCFPDVYSFLKCDSSRLSAPTSSLIIGSSLISENIPT